MVVLDHKEYARLKEIEEDKSDYYSAVMVKQKNKRWKFHEDLKNELNLK